MKIREITATAFMSAVICASSLIYIPFAVPLTLQTFAVFLALFTLGGKYGTLSVFVYICIGAAGLPVFSGFGGGIARLFDASGGYVFGFLFAALVYWLITSRAACRTARLFAAAVALAVIYAVGTAWYSFVYLGGFGSILSAAAVTVLPFVLPDILKLLLAYFLSKRISSSIRP